MKDSTRGALVGAGLGLGAPLGWFGIRCLHGAVCLAEMDQNVLLYGYLFVSTETAFIIFGAFSGMLLDRLGEINEQLRRLSTLDPLTGLGNQREFGERLPIEAARARRTGAPLALIVVDLDRFKRLNDELGHDTGDAALAHAAAVLRASIREVDVACRIGGDEFAVICPGATIAGAAAVAERARAALEKSAFRSPDGRLATLTASFGVSALNAGDRQLFQASDHALYAAKALGRNRVHVG